MNDLILARTIFSVYSRLDGVLKRFDKTISRYCANSYTLTLDPFYTLDGIEGIIDIMEQKKQLVTLKCVIEEGLDTLNHTDAKILKQYYIEGLSMGQLAFVRNVGQLTANAYLRHALNKFIKNLSSINISKIDVENIVKNNLPLARIYNKFLLKTTSKRKKEFLPEPKQPYRIRKLRVPNFF